MMSRMTSRREFIQGASLAATGIVAASQPLAGGVSLSQAQSASVPQTKGAHFRQLLEAGEPFENIAVFDVMTARMTEILGFPSLSIGGSAVDEFLWPARLRADGRELQDRVRKTSCGKRRYSHNDRHC